jgi:hypothetical protein
MPNRSSLRLPTRLIAGAALVGLALGLSGCGGKMNSFDPTDWLDFLDTKKPLPGDRKPVFPEGVPGVEQGVPKDLYKGAPQQDDAAATPPPAPAAPEPKAKSKHAGKKTAPSEQPAAAPEPDASPTTDEGATPPPPPKKQVTKRKRTTAPPPDDTSSQQPAPAQQQPAVQSPQQQTAPFPAPLPSGGFSH